MDGNAFLQFELWKDCPHNCGFCFNKPWRHNFNKKIKLINLDYALNYLNTNDLSGYDFIGYIGGEFFTGALRDSEVRYNFYKLIEKTCELLNNGVFKRFQFTANLLYLNEFDEQDFFDFLEYLRLHTDLSKCLLCTSYDTKYRFNNDKELENWKRLMKLLKGSALYRKLNLHVETIPTQAFIDLVLNDEFNIIEFKKEFQCAFDIADIHTGYGYKTKLEMQKDLPEFFPKREDFLKFLTKVFSDGALNRDNICHFNSMAYTLYFPRSETELGDKALLTERAGKDTRLPYGNQETSDYIDSNESMLEDISDIWDLIH